MDGQNTEQTFLSETKINCFPLVLPSRINRDKTMADKLMYINNVDTQNYPFYRLKLVVQTFGHLMNQPMKIQ